MSPRTILMLGYPGSQILDITGPMQMFAAANDELGRTVYTLRLASPARGAFATSSGLRLVADLGFADLDGRRLARVDTLIVAGGDPGLRIALHEGVVTGIVARARSRVRRLASVCSGAFFLAAAGVLDGRRATTHWRAADDLRRFRPAVRLDADAIHVRDGDIWTSAGVTAGIDLALAMIEADHGRDLALDLARRHVVFRIRPGGQSQYSAELAAQAAPAGRLARLAEQVTDRPDADWRAETLAACAGVSPRSLSRLFRGALDTSPAAFVERVRLDRARRALLDSDAGVEAIAAGCGFGSLRRMDRAFARTVGVSPTAFRARFSINGGAS
jgi:transcriptional regulator GlxA family with amidase domain